MKKFILLLTLLLPCIALFSQKEINFQPNEEVYFDKLGQGTFLMVEDWSSNERKLVVDGKLLNWNMLQKAASEKSGNDLFAVAEVISTLAEKFPTASGKRE